MSLLYKPKEEQTYSVDIEQKDGKVNMLFWSDCGKFGTDEIMDEHNLTVEELLQILQNSDDEQCNIPVVTKRNWFEKLPLHWRFLLYYI